MNDYSHLDPIAQAYAEKNDLAWSLLDRMAGEENAEQNPENFPALLELFTEFVLKLDRDTLERIVHRVRVERQLLLPDFPEENDDDDE